MCKSRLAALRACRNQPRLRTARHSMRRPRRCVAIPSPRFFSRRWISEPADIHHPSENGMGRQFALTVCALRRHRGVRANPLLSLNGKRKTCMGKRQVGPSLMIRHTGCPSGELDRQAAGAISYSIDDRRRHGPKPGRQKNTSGEIAAADAATQTAKPMSVTRKGWLL